MKSLTKVLALVAVLALALTCFAPARANAEAAVEYEEKTIKFDLSEEDPDTTLETTDFGDTFPPAPSPVTRSARWVTTATACLSISLMCT